MSLFKKMLSESIEADLAKDEESLEKSMESPEHFSELKNEVDDITNNAIDNSKEILDRAEHYSLKITEKILPMLRKLHDEITSGLFIKIAPNLKGISKINEELASLAEALRGRVKDDIAKKQQEQ